MNEMIYRLIEHRLRSLWKGSFDDVDFDNIEFTPRRGIPYIRLQIEPVGNDPISIGGLDRSTGIILVSIFYPTNKPVADIMAGADAIGKIFGRWNEGQMQTGPSRVQRIGQKEEWFQMNVLIDYQYDVCEH